MKNKESWQIEAGAAKFYEQHFVPALYAQWPPRTVRAAQVKRGDRVLDIAAGTGIVARFAENQTAPTGSVVGYDINPGMVVLANSLAPHIEWVVGPAEKLPFDDATFDAVTCQFGLPYFQDPVAALREMKRVLKKGGRLALTVWDSLDNTPGYRTLIGLVDQVCGSKAADLLRLPYSASDLGVLNAWCHEAGFPVIAVNTMEGMAKFDSVPDWLNGEIKHSPLQHLVSDEQFSTLQSQAVKTLRPFTTTDGRVLFHTPAHIATALK